MSSTILVAMSDAAIHTLIHDILSRRGCRVLSASSLEEAENMTGTTGAEVAFVDMSLDGDVAGFIYRCRSRNIPVVALVDSHLEHPSDYIADIGGMAHMKMPLTRDLIESLARQGIEMHRCWKALSDNGACPHSGLQMQEVLEAVDDAVFLLDADMHLSVANDVGLRQIGGDSDNVVGRPYLSLLPRPSAKLLRETLEQVKASGKERRVEEFVNGHVYSTTVRPVFEGAVLSGMVVVTRDHSAQRRSEEGLAESEKRYRSVYDAARDAIIMFDRADGSILDCNVAARRLYGYSEEAMLEMSIADLSGEPERSMDVIRSGTGRVPLQYHVRKGGAQFPVEMSMSHFMNNDRDVCTAFIRDISQHKMVQEALQEGARLYRAVVEDQTELICRYAPDGLLTFVNGAYARFFGVDEDEIIGHEFFPELAEQERRDLRHWVRQAGPAEPVFDREQQVLRSDGEPRWLLWTNRAILNNRGEVQEVQAVGRDVTERREAERALSVATEEKERYRRNLEATFRSIPDAIISVDSQCRVIATNSAASPFLVLERAKVRGKAMEDLVADSGNPCLTVVKQVLTSGKPVRGYEAKLDLPSLGERMVELNCTPLIDPDKEHSGAVLVIRDVSRIVDLEKRLHERHGFRGIIGRSSRMQDMYKLLEQLSSLESTVLILGESGTGKELVAEALHYGGPRASASMIKVNCSALSESLLESELFGHVRGAFTGAVRDKVGRIQAAQGGSLFLDEIGDISPLIQLKLLRFLEQKEYERVGESKTHSADVRIIAATNVDLMQAVKQGTFREDLYYRLNVMPVALPPLRERQADIPLLADHFLEVFSRQFKKTFSKVSDEVMDIFMSYGWPGNVRELRHILEHACILCPGGAIELRHMRRDLVEQMRMSAYPTAANLPFAERDEGMIAMREQSIPINHNRKVGREVVLEVLNQCGGNKARAARELGIHRATLYRKLKRWGLEE